MWLINLAITLFSIIKTKAFECVSVTNQECMPRPKILDVNEGVGEALFYPYNVLVNKCNGSCNMLDDSIISCDKGYMWNPSTCECQCDM